MKLFKFNAPQHSEVDNDLILIKKIKESVKDEENLDNLCLAFNTLQKINLNGVTDPDKLKEASDLMLDIQLNIMYQCEKDEKNIDKLILAFQVLNGINIDGIDDHDLWKAAKGYRGSIYGAFSQFNINVLEGHMKGMSESLKGAILEFIKKTPASKSKL